jgi:putative membrane protein
MDSKTFFSKESHDRIDAAVVEAEKNTSGEIVPVLATAADEYARGLFLAGAWASIIATLAFVAVKCIMAFTGSHSQPETFDGHIDWTLVLHESLHVPLHLLFPIQIAAYILGYVIAKNTPALKRAFIAREEMEAEVARAAHEQFYSQRLNTTRDATGIMIYVSLFERMVVVLTDKSIEVKHDQATWDKVRDLVLDGFKSGKPDEGYIAAIQECGRILAVDFPCKHDDTNELADHLRTV